MEDGLDATLNVCVVVFSPLEKSPIGVCPTSLYLTDVPCVTFTTHYEPVIGWFAAVALLQLLREITRSGGRIGESRFKENIERENRGPSLALDSAWREMFNILQFVKDLHY